MACGCVPILPKTGGVSEYAIDGKNSILVDTLSEDNCYLGLVKLIQQPELTNQLREHAMMTGIDYSIEKAAMSELKVLRNAWLEQELSS